MNDKTASRRSPLIVFGAVSVPVFLFVLLTGVLVTFILPESFASTARIKLDRKMTSGNDSSSVQSSSAYDPRVIQTQLEIIQSEIVLGNVVEQMDLNSRWGRKYLGDNGRLETPEVLTLLKGRLDIRPIHNTSLVEIRVYSDEPKEAAEIANQIAKAYSGCAASAPESVQVSVIDTALPVLRPVRPNKPLNIVLSALVGGVLGLGAGAAGFWLTVLIQRKRLAKSAP